MRKTIILIQLQIRDSMMRFCAHMMQKIQALIRIYYQLQNYNVVYLYYLPNRHMFLDLDFDKV